MHLQLEMNSQKLSSQNQSQNHPLVLIQCQLRMKWVKVMENVQEPTVKTPRIVPIPMLEMHSGCSQNFNRCERWQLQKISSSLDQARKRASRNNREAHRSPRTKMLQGVSDRTDMAQLIVTYSTIMKTRTALRFCNSRIIERKFQILQIKMQLLKTVRWVFLSVQTRWAWIKATTARRSLQILLTLTSSSSTCYRLNKTKLSTSRTTQGKAVETIIPICILPIVRRPSLPPIHSWIRVAVALEHKQQTSITERILVCQVKTEMEFHIRLVNFVSHWRWERGERIQTMLRRKWTWTNSLALCRIHRGRTTLLLVSWIISS